MPWFGDRTDFLNGTDANPVSFAEGTIDSSRLGHTHLGTVDQGRHIGGIGITVPDKTATVSGFKNGSSENVATACMI
jgi:hypothetical protein